MANPNIVDVTSIFGKTAVQAVGTSPTAIVSATSNRVKKINTLIVSNVDGTNDARITVDLFRSSTAYHIAKEVTVPAGASLVVITKENSVYLEETDDLRLTASVAGDLEAVCSYEEIDDAIGS